MVSGYTNGGDVVALLVQQLGAGIGMVYRFWVAAKVLLKGLAGFSLIVNAADLFSVIARLKRLSKLFCQTGCLSEMFF